MCTSNIVICKSDQPNSTTGDGPEERRKRGNRVTKSKKDGKTDNTRHEVVRKGVKEEQLEV